MTPSTFLWAVTRPLESMLNVVDGGLIPVLWEDLDPATVQEGQRESNGYTLSVLKDYGLKMLWRLLQAETK